MLQLSIEPALYIKRKKKKNSGILSLSITFVIFEEILENQVLTVYISLELNHWIFLVDTWKNRCVG